mmetsp:Transcript_368/g.780  ORF Transcript_368/g.780 Transcript_368/m.780 type:complete len:95 (-) Transcript_368:261-545(-)
MLRSCLGQKKVSLALGQPELFSPQPRRPQMSSLIAGDVDEDQVFFGCNVLVDRPKENKALHFMNNLSETLVLIPSLGYRSSNGHSSNLQDVFWL